MDLEESVFSSALKALLPKKVYIGISKSCVQIAKLEMSDESIDYNMNNDSPSGMPKHGLYFDYKSFTQWINNINEIVRAYYKIQYRITVYSRMAELINEIFDWYKYVTIPKFNPDIRYKTNSIIRRLDIINVEYEKSLVPFEQKLINFLTSNKLLLQDETIETLKPSLLNDRLLDCVQKWDEYSQELEVGFSFGEYVEFELSNKITKREKSNLIFSALKLADRKKVPYAIAHKFILTKCDESCERIKQKKLQKKNKKREKELREKMKQKWG